MYAVVFILYIFIYNKSLLLLILNLDVEPRLALNSLFLPGLPSAGTTGVKASTPN